MLEKIKKVIEMQFDIDPSEMEITENTDFREDLNGDSLDLFEVLMQLEDEFSVEIPSEDMEKLKTVGDVMNYLEAKGVE